MQWQNRPDVSILRVTAGMLADHASDWNRCLLRVEPMVLVGRPGDDGKLSASLRERPFEVFGKPPESGSYVAYGTYLAALELELKIRHARSVQPLPGRPDPGHQPGTVSGFKARSNAMARPGFPYTARRMRSRTPVVPEVAQ